MSAPSAPKPLSCIVFKIDSTSAYHAPIVGASSSHRFEGRLDFWRSAAHVQPTETLSMGMPAYKEHMKTGTQCVGERSTGLGSRRDRRAQAVAHVVRSPLSAGSPSISMTRLRGARQKLFFLVVGNTEKLEIARSHFEIITTENLFFPKRAVSRAESRDPAVWKWRAQRAKEEAQEDPPATVRFLALAPRLCHSSLCRTRINSGKLQHETVDE